MTIDFDAIKARSAAVQAAGVSVSHTRLVDHGIRVWVRFRDWDGTTAHGADEAVTNMVANACADIGALVAEVELLRAGRDVTRAYADRLEAEVVELRGERAAVVAWLREVADTPVPWVDDAIRDAALAIERGEHRSEGEE